MKALACTSPSPAPLLPLTALPSIIIIRFQPRSGCAGFPFPCRRSPPSNPHRGELRGCGSVLRFKAASPWGAVSHMPVQAYSWHQPCPRLRPIAANSGNHPQCQLGNHPHGSATSSSRLCTGHHRFHPSCGDPSISIVRQPGILGCWFCRCAIESCTGLCTRSVIGPPVHASAN